MYTAGKISGKICLKAFRDTFFSNMWPVIRDCREAFPESPPLVGQPDLTVRKTLRRVVSPLTVMVLKRVNESIFFQSIKFTVRLKR